MSFRRRALANVLDGSFDAIARAGSLHPLSRPESHGLERIAGIPYGEGPDHVLDAWRPVERNGPLPVVLYLHGGGFRALSKDTHYVMAIAFARRGYLVLSANYRLSPMHKFPSAAMDACAAWVWATEHARELGGDPSRMAVAGESAGGNLTSVVALCSAWKRPEPWARAVWEAQHRPIAALPACGILQVSPVERRVGGYFGREVIANVADSYLPVGSDLDCSLADPVCVVEQHPPDRTPPPFFLACGTRDPLIADSRRMAAALRGHGVPVELREYAGEVHAFHAFFWLDNSRRCWAEMHSFLDRAVSASPPPPS